VVLMRVQAPLHLGTKEIGRTSEPMAPGVSVQGKCTPDIMTSVEIAVISPSELCFRPAVCPAYALFSADNPIRDQQRIRCAL
jgi:hypothetical protein